MTTPDIERVWAEMRSSLRSFVSRRVRQPADTDDIVQHVFLQLHRSLPTLRDADRVSAWIYRTARHAIADFYRAPAHRREVLVGDVQDMAEAERLGLAEPEASARADLARCLQPLLAQLGEGDRQALQLVEVEEWRQADAARHLGLSVSGMKSRVQRARAHLRTVVDNCCKVELDRRGGVITYEARGTRSCDDCAPGTSAACES